MKRTITLLVALVCVGTLMAQNVMLTYENHGFVSGQDNEMKIANHVEPGPAGQDLVWDLSAMEMTKELLGTVKPAVLESAKKSLSKTDVVLNEFGNKFYFKQNNRSLELYGSETASGAVHTEYNQPFVKMVYPFKYGDQFSGNYSGSKFIREREIGITGTYDVSADGYGKVILPGGKEYMALRVKTIQRYSMNYSNPVEYEITSYRWYVNTERYPIAVVQTIMANTASGNTSTSKRSAYKYPSLRNLEVSDVGLSLYPNPANEQMTIEYTVQDEANVTVELYDQAGRKIATLLDEERNAGIYTYTLETGKFALKEGSYIIRSVIGNQVVTKSFIKQ